MHSEYSVSDGIVRIDDAVQRAAADHMPALALTDAANLFGMVKFYAAARGAGMLTLMSRSGIPFAIRPSEVDYAKRRQGKVQR